MTEVQDRSLIAGCMDMTVAETLDVLAELKSPVVRTCHYGNTPANNLGWIALAKNTYFGSMDHTLYGIDDIFLPWVLLGDRGRVEACFDHRGEPVAGLVGRHANALRGSVARKHWAFFSFGIFAEHGGEDLICRHVRLSADLARRWNGSTSLPRSAELLALRPLLTRLIRRFHARRSLGALFNKWVRTTRGRYALMLKIKRIDYTAGGDVAIYTTDSDLNFQGSVEALIEAFFSGMEQVSARLASGRRFTSLGYPWINIFMNFLLNAVKEYAADPAQRVFWHTSAATNHLYVRGDWFQRGYTTLLGELEREGFLPPGSDLRMIPTYSCQLFATRAESLAALEELISCWREFVRAQGGRFRELLAAFERAADPVEVVEDLFRGIEPFFLQELHRRLAEFNALDPHRLPVAYAVESRHPTYNKYGIAQCNLSDKRPVFPRGFMAMRWGEAELLTKTLARLVIDECE